jgi:hypothetical protein
VEIILLILGQTTQTRNHTLQWTTTTDGWVLRIAVIRPLPAEWIINVFSRSFSFPDFAGRDRHGVYGSLPRKWQPPAESCDASRWKRDYPADFLNRD